MFASTAVIRDRMSVRLHKAIRHGLNAGEEDEEADTITVFSQEGNRKASVIQQRTTPFGDKITVDKVPISAQHSPTTSPIMSSSATLSRAAGKKSLPEPAVEITTSAPLQDGVMILVDGKAVTINSQIQFYATNRQINHPYVSPVLGYLGGLPPCFFIASDKECLRDEIIYT